MRKLLLACLAAAILAAGCTQTSSPTPSPSHGLCTQQAPDCNDSGQGGGQGIAPGEPAPGGHPSGGALVRPAHAEEENSTAHLRIVADESASGLTPGGRVLFSYNATNTGADATTHGACERPYAFRLFDANGTEHALDVPRMHCLALSNDPFPAGASMEFNATWNGTYAEGDHLVQAPYGAYVFECTFTAWRPGDASGETVAAKLPVNVVRMGQQ